MCINVKLRKCFTPSFYLEINDTTFETKLSGLCLSQKYRDTNNAQPLIPNSLSEINL